MLRKDFYLLGVLWVIVLCIFLPLFYSDYIFMDEALEIWQYNAIPGHQMFADDGRWLAEITHSWLFKQIDTIHQVKWVRLISLFGWLLCLPVWYSIIKRLVASVPAYEYLPFFICLYLVTSLPFLVSVQWATCMQFFIANTVALLSGAAALNCIQAQDIKKGKRIAAGLVSVALGLISLFFYQSAYACFLIPFLLHFINPFTQKKDRVLVSGLAFHLAVCAVYFVMYKAIHSIYFGGYNASRNVLYLHPIEKMMFFLARPLERSFRFTLLTDEESAVSAVYYPLMIATLTVLAFIRFGFRKWQLGIKYLAGIGCLWVVSYLPPLLTTESYASNRTLMALNLCVFIVCLEMALWFIKNKRVLQIAGIALICFFTLCARYNFQQVFLRPVVLETAVLKAYFKKHYNSSIQTIHYIRTKENYWVDRIPGFNRSMDEIGAVSSTFLWVPPPLSKQLIYELTGDRKLADKVTVKHWPNKEEYLKAHEVLNSSILLVDVPEILNAASL
jgi:hypothetical protein